MKKVIFILAILQGSFTFAGECKLNITRVACPGNEAESFKKCDGKASCEEKMDAASAKDCAKKALKACENARLTVTKSKTIMASFDGASVEAGKNFCEADRSDFNKCK